MNFENSATQNLSETKFDVRIQLEASQKTHGAEEIDQNTRRAENMPEIVQVNGFMADEQQNTLRNNEKVHEIYVKNSHLDTLKDSFVLSTSRQSDTFTIENPSNMQLSARILEHHQNQPSLTKEQLKLENYKLKMQIERLKQQVSQQTPDKSRDDLETPATASYMNSHVQSSECVNTSILSEEHHPAAFSQHQKLKIDLRRYTQ